MSPLKQTSSAQIGHNDAVQNSVKRWIQYIQLSTQFTQALYIKSE